MNFNPLSLRRTCRQAAALLIAREDQVLAIPDRVALKLHLMACKTCPKFKNQLSTLRAAMSQWRNDTGERDDQASLSNPAPPEI
ncbi:MAG: zf-HC2 domain-containing protein [Polaromonas sp.]